MEMDIPTGFQEQSTSYLIPSVSELAIDFAIVWEKIRSFLESEIDACQINTEGHRLDARLFRFHCHLGTSGSLPSSPRVDARDSHAEPGSHGLPPSRKKTIESGSCCAPSTDPGGEAIVGAYHRIARGAVRAAANPRQETEGVDPLGSASAGRPITAMLISEHPPLSKELSAPYVAYREVTTVARAVISCGKLFFGRDPEKVTSSPYQPQLLAMVLDFLASNAPREASDVPHYINRALNNLPNA
ncbi:hypothetical protein OROMI_017892 [Orobanche minor]